MPWRHAAEWRFRSVDRFFQFASLGMVASGYLALVGSGRLPAITIALTAPALIYRLLLVTGLARTPKTDRWVGVVTLAYVVFYPVDWFFLTGDFLGATVNLVLFLLVVKILIAASDRDHIQVLLIAFLAMLAAALLSTSLSYFGFLMAFVICAVAAFASWDIRRSMSEHTSIARSSAHSSWRLAWLTSSLGIGVLVLTAGLFFVLPRTARAALEGLMAQGYHLPGISDEVTLGDLGEIQQDSSVLMHVRMTGDGANMPGLKWRGNALTNFDGLRWSTRASEDTLVRVPRAPVPLADEYQRSRLGRRLNYEVQLKPMASDMLFIAGKPEWLSIDAPIVFHTSEDGWRLRSRPSEVVRYGVYAFVEQGAADPPPPPAPLSPDDRSVYLELPQLDPRISQLASDVTMPYRRPADKALAVEQYLHSNYTYTLDLPDKPAADPLSEFLFVRRTGHCEYFASAMAVMLREVGIPARLATGFQSGLYNPISGWRLIRAADAHTWVEAWLPNTGWTTFDPTPPDPSANSYGFWTRFSFLMDAADIFWQDWVIDYDLNRQLTLAARVDASRREVVLPWLNGWREWLASSRDEATAWARQSGPTGLAILLALAALWMIAPRLARWLAARLRAFRLERGQAEASDATLLYQRALDALHRRGIQKPTWLTPTEFARMAPAPVAGTLTELTAAYNDLRFGGNPEAAARMLTLLERLETF